MKYSDLSFNVVDENGIELINDIVGVVPNHSDSSQPYVVFTDYTLDSNDEFINKYAKLVQEDDNYFLDTNLSEKEILYIKNTSNDEIVKYVNDTIGENLHD